jgi:hypothetical protein
MFKMPSGLISKGGPGCLKTKPSMKRKSSKERLSTEAQAFSTRSLECEDDTFLKWKGLQKNLDTQAQASGSRMLEGEGDAFPKQWSLRKHSNAKAQTSGNGKGEK